MAPADRLPGLRGAAPFTSLKRMRSMRSTMDLTPLYRASIGFDRIAPPDGAFYAWADCTAAARRLGVEGSDFSIAYDGA